MRCLAILALIAGGLHAQNPADLFNKPPEEVDKALRARITEFYQLHVTSKHRQAEALVAEDTKDYFYSHKKPTYVSFEIVRIEYSQNFTKAAAHMLTEQYVPFPGFGDKPLKAASKSLWKLEDGKWCWYVDQEAFRETPAGRMSPGPGARTGAGLPPLPGGGLPSLPGAGPASPGGGIPGVKLEEVLNRVKADKQSIGLKAGSAEEVKFTNTAQGKMELRLLGTPDGIEAKFDRTELNSNDVAVLTVRAGKDAKAGPIRVQVAQTSEVIAIQAAVK